MKKRKKLTGNKKMNEIKKLAKELNELDNYTEEKIINPTINLNGFIITDSSMPGCKYRIYHESLIGSCLDTDSKKDLIKYMEKWPKPVYLK